MSGFAARRQAASWRAAIAVIVATGMATASGAFAGPLRAAAPAQAPSLGARISAAGAGARAGWLRGPRPRLPRTFVPIEVRRFPLPAAAACRDNTRVLRVPSRRFRTLTAAIAAARPGTRIVVAPGRYVEHRDSDVALEVSTSNVCLIAPRGPATVLAASGQQVGLRLSGHRTVVARLTLTGFSSGVELGRPDGATQRSVTLTDVVVRSPAHGWNDGIAARYDHGADRPVIAGLLLDRVRISGATLGISCDAGPCTHWWLHGVRVTGKGEETNSGADAFAVESGRQIVVTDSRFTGAAADGIDLKARDVVVAGAWVDVSRNAVKLWHGGDVQDTVVTGSGADAALVGDGVGRYRYLRVDVTGHDPKGSGYVGTWGYDSQGAIRLTISRSRFANNASGGLYLSGDPASRLRLVGNVFADEGSKLVDFRSMVLPTTAAGLERLQALGWGHANRMG